MKKKTTKTKIKRKPGKKEKTSFFKSLPKVLKVLSGIVAGIATLIGAIAGLSVVLEKYGILSTPDPYTIEVKCLDVFPFSLKNSIGAQDFLYWFHFHVENKSSKPLHFEVSFKVRQGPAKVIGAPALFTVNPREEFSHMVDPAFEFLADNVNANLELTWKINDEKQNILKQGTKRILVLPKTILDWNLTTPEGKPFPEDFLIASLAAWVQTSDPGIKECASQMLPGIDSQYDPLAFAYQWFSQCHHKLFNNSNGLKIRPEGPVPMKGRQLINEPAQVLNKRYANPLEGVLLLTALSRSAFKKLDLRTVMFVIPGDEDLSYLLSWSDNGYQWHAIDITRIDKMEFERNEELATLMVNDLLEKKPEIIRALDDRGVFFEKGRLLIALDFARSAIQFCIRGLP